MITVMAENSCRNVSRNVLLCSVCVILLQPTAECFCNTYKIVSKNDYVRLASPGVQERKADFLFCLEVSSFGTPQPQCPQNRNDKTWQGLLVEQIRTEDLA